MAYSVFLYAWILTLSSFNSWTILLTLLEKGEDFLMYIFNGLLLNAMLLSGSIPALIWLDCPKFVQYMNRWAEFQVRHSSNWWAEFQVRHSSNWWAEFQVRPSSIWWAEFQVRHSSIWWAEFQVRHSNIWPAVLNALSFWLQGSLLCSLSQDMEAQMGVQAYVYRVVQRISSGKLRFTAVGIRCAGHATPFIRKSRH
jgi:hypothetical protein